MKNANMSNIVKLFGPNIATAVKNAATKGHFGWIAVASINQGNTLCYKLVGGIMPSDKPLHVFDYSAGGFIKTGTRISASTFALIKQNATPTGPNGEMYSDYIEL